MNRYYIAYGSNLNIHQMRMRCPDAKVLGTSTLKDYRLLFKGSRTGSYLTIEPAEGHSVCEFSERLRNGDRWGFVCEITWKKAKTSLKSP